MVGGTTSSGYAGLIIIYQLHTNMLSTARKSHQLLHPRQGFLVRVLGFVADQLVDEVADVKFLLGEQ